MFTERESCRFCNQSFHVMYNVMCLCLLKENRVDFINKVFMVYIM